MTGSQPDEVVDLDSALRTLVRVALSDPSMRVADRRRLSGGASRETHAFDAVAEDGRRRPLILQRRRPGPAFAGPTMTTEDALLAAAAQAGVPVPATVVDVATATPLLGEARISEQVPGEALGRRLVRAERSAAGRRVLAMGWGRALARIHSIDPSAVTGLDAVDDPLAMLRDGLDEVGEARPAFELALRWLASRRPPAGPERVVHGDFRVGNLLVDGDELTAVLDWELAHRGDALEDLGWLCVRAWRFGGAREVGGVADLDDLLAGYAESGAPPIDPAHVRWWTAVGTLRWGLICAVQARRHLDGHVRSVELATIGRRVSENEHDLLTLMGVDLAAPTTAATPVGPLADGLTAEPTAGRAGGGRPATTAASSSPRPATAFDPYPATANDPLEATALGAPRGRPTAAELVEAVRGHLADVVAPELVGAAAFHTRVADRALAIVERELRLGPGIEAAHRRRLDALGYRDDVALAAAIRAGRLDGRHDVEVAVAADVADRLQVDNPSWPRTSPRPKPEGR